MQSPQPDAKARLPQTMVCPVCASPNVTIFMDLDQVPVHCNLLWETREGAVGAPRGDVSLGYCADCSHVYNYAFDPAHTEYTQSYENSLHFSPRFQSYADALVLHLIDRYDLRDKDLIEVGCGKGDFLRQICRAGGNRGLGFDRSYVPDDQEDGAAVRFVIDFFGEQYAHEPADMIICRHVLEHIERPGPFLEGIRRAIPAGRKPVIFFEMPNVLWTLRDLGIWDIIYEHCSYFSPASLVAAFEAAGFAALDLREEFGGQFLAIEAVPIEGAAPATARSRLDFAQVGREVAAFADNYQAKVAHWNARLAALADAGQRAVVWGSGSKGVTFLNTFRERSPIEYVVDINPRKQGMHVAGTGQKIVAPEFLRIYQPDAVIVMNAIYTGEIEQMLATLGVGATIECA